MSRTKKILASIGVFLVVIAGVNVATAGAASAAPYCQNNYICMYEHIGGAGSAYWMTGSYGLCQNVSGSWNDRVSSIKNFGKIY